MSNFRSPGTLKLLSSHTFLTNFEILLPQTPLPETSTAEDDSKPILFVFPSSDSRDMLDAIAQFVCEGKRLRIFPFDPTSQLTPSLSFSQRKHNLSIEEANSESL